MENNLFKRNKKKIFVSTALGIMLIVSVIFAFMDIQKMDVQGSQTMAEKIAAVKAQLPTVASEQGVTVSVPLTVDDMTQSSYNLVNEYDWMALMVLSYETDLTGKTFYIEKTCDLTGIVIGEQPFMGISLNSGIPFKGNLVSKLGERSLKVTTNCALFGYLDASAGINRGDSEVTLDLIVNDGTSGLAQVFMGNGTVTNADIKNVYLSGTIVNTTGAAGGVFGEIIGGSGDPLSIASLGVTSSISSVKGINAGGFAGKISGNISMTIAQNMIPAGVSIVDVSDVNAGAGNFVGTIEGTEAQVIEISVADGIFVASDMSKCYGYFGGLFGKVTYTNMTFMGSVTADGRKIGASDNAGTCYNGGLIGYLANSTITTVPGSSMNLKTDLNGQHSGGFCGYMTNSTVTLPVVSIATNINGGGCIGGLVGYSNSCNVTMESIRLYNGGTIVGYAVYAGGVIGQDIGSTYTMPTVTYESAIKVESKYANCNVGGFAGSLSDTNLVLANGVMTNKNTVISTAETTTADQLVFVGGFVGRYETTQDRTLTNIVIQEPIIYSSTAAYKTYVGGVIGGIYGTGAVNLQSCSALDIHANGNTGQMQLGGIVGGNFNPYLTIQGTAENKIIARFTSDGSVYWRTHTLGGIVGFAAANCQVVNAEVRLATGSPGGNTTRLNRLGGYVGYIGKNTFVSLENISFSSGANHLTNEYGGSAKLGGLVAEMEDSAVLELNGDIDMRNLNNASWSVCAQYYGAIVAAQNNSLVYINPTGYADGKYVYGLQIIADLYPDEISNYGAMYRNGNWDSTTGDMMDKSTWLIQKTTDCTVSIKADGDPYTLATVGDVMRLSIALNTEDRFTGFTSPNTWTELLKADKTYTVTGHIDISDTGITTINKNHNAVTSVNTYGFQGTLTGTGVASSSITNSIFAAQQSYLGLFSSVKNATISNLTINTEIICSYTDSLGKPISPSYNLLSRQHAGGIAAYAVGNVNVINVNLNTKFEEDSSTSVLENFAKKNRYLGGAFGYYAAANSTALTMNNVNADVDMYIVEETHYAGGLVGHIQLGNITSAGLNLSQITVSGTLAFACNNNSTTGFTEDIAKVGGLVALIGEDTQVVAVDKKIQVQLENITVSGLQIVDRSTSDTWRNLHVGGLLGYLWKNVDLTADGITVQENNSVIPGFTSSIRSKGIWYGGLWNTVNGHMLLKDVAIDDLAINVQTGAADKYNGLLVGNGQYLYLELDGYTIDGDGDAKVTWTDAGAKYLDEIVGYSQGNAVGNVDESCGGIISIHTANEYQLYSNQLIAQNNPYSRYYYNLSADLTGVSEMSSSTHVIDSAQKMLQWSLAHYANTSLRQFFSIASTYDKYTEIVNFQGTIDLGDVSYYPVTVNGGTYSGNSANIIFHGGDFDNMVKNWKASNIAEQLLYPYEEKSEHYQLHSGLFHNVTTSVIQNMTLSGTVTAMQVNGAMYSGALISGTIFGVVADDEVTNGYINYTTTPTNIYGIVLDNLAVSHVVESDNWAGYYGLLIAKVGSGATVNIGYEDATTEKAGVTMTGYQTDTKVAAALIGQVGDEQAQGINLSLVNMKVADVADGVDTPGLVGESTQAELDGAQVLAYASFIYDYCYQLDNTTGIYIFYLEDYQNDAVTLGSEIGDTVQFYDDEIVTPIKEYTADVQNGCLVFDETYYKPYVYQSQSITPKKEIDVNPKTGNITEGCGTYDSPYVIENANQLMTLYKYLKDKDVNEKSLKGWEINAFGVDAVSEGAALVTERIYVKKHYNVGSKKDADDNPTDYISDYESLAEGGFPTVEQLNNAYYIIRGNIDLTDATDFTGFGTDTLPFTGVFVGATLNNGEMPKISMPKTTTVGGEITYAFIKYAKGAVVKNLHIVLGDEDSVDDPKVVEIAGTGAGVMAVVLGGDNLIDTVKVSGIMKTGLYTTAGGYVGDLQNGSVILRGMTATSLSDFTISRVSGEGDGVGAYQKVMAGKVQDGYILDDDGSFANYVPRDGMAATDILNVADTNGSYTGTTISDCVVSLNKNDKITVTQSAETGYNYVLNSAQDLLVLSLTLNSGAMNYQGETENAQTYGYDQYSRCRNSDYSYVGNVVTDAAKTQYLNVIKYDNGNTFTNDGQEDYLCAGRDYGDSFYHPYIYQQFAFGDNVEVMLGTTLQSLSAWNQYITDTEAQAQYKALYTLQPGMYDMSAYEIKKCFRGIGARNNGNLCSLRGDFMGAGSEVTIPDGDSSNTTTIKVDLDIAKYRDAALFNTLYAGTINNYGGNVIGGFNLTGDIVNIHNNGYVAAAGITTLVFGKYDFMDICVKDIKINSTVSHETGTNPYNMAAGFVVRADNYTVTEQTNAISFVNCKLKNATVEALHDCGGFIAINEKNGEGNAFMYCSVEQSHITTQNGDLGGFIGESNYPAVFMDCNLIGSSVVGSVTSLSKGGTMRVGGFLGKSKHQIMFQNCDIKNYVVNNDTTVSKVAVEFYKNLWNNYCGGYVGYVESASLPSCHELVFDNCDIEGLTLNQCTSGSVGGYVGQCGARLVVNQAENAKSEISNVTILKNFNQSTGGLVGYMGGFNFSYSENYPSEIKNVDMIGLEIDYRREDGGGPNLGGIVGYINVRTNLRNVRLLGTAERPTYLHFSVGKQNGVNLYLGGLAGNVAYSPMTVENCMVGSINEDGTAATECYTKLLGGRYAGGFFGNLDAGSFITVVNPQLNYVQLQGAYTGTDTVSGVHGAVGGIFGKQEDGTMTIQDVNVSNVDIRNYDLTPTTDATTQTNMANTKKRTIAMGGLGGLAKKSVTVQGFNITNLNIGKDGYGGEAGGILGIVFGGTATIENSLTDDASVSQISDSTIIAGVAGGLIGNTQKNSNIYASTHVSDVKLTNVSAIGRFLNGTNWEIFAGGVTGRHQASSNQINRYENIYIEDSVVAAYSVQNNDTSRAEKVSTGAFIGGQEASEVQAYQITVDNVLTGTLKWSESAETIPTYAKVVSGDEILYQTKATYNTSVSYAQEAIQDTLYVSTDYVMNHGTFCGKMIDVNNSYVIRANVSYDENLTQYRPAIDVGVDPTSLLTILQTENAGMPDAYATYRDVYHIVYRDDFDGVVTSGFIGNQLSLQDYYFDHLDEVYDTRFSGQIVDDNNDYRFEENYLQDDDSGNNCAIMDVLEASYRTVDDEGNIIYLSPYVDGSGNQIPMLMASGDYDIDTVIHTAINILTNNGGTGAMNITDVLVERVQLSQDNSTIAKISDGKEVITYVNNQFMVSLDDYDTITDKTFNLITVTYTHSDSQKYQIHIPVFVREMLKIETHMKGMDGNHYLLADVPKSDSEPAEGYTQINVELQSIYTLYTEFIYSSARQEYASVALEKCVYRKNNVGGYVPFEVGTKITLLDITGNNMAYYYEVTEENKSKERIQFSEFKAIDGTSYINAELGKNSTYENIDSYRNICNQTGAVVSDVGLEQFMIIVDETNVGDVPHAIYNLYVRAEEEDNDTLFKNAKAIEPCYVKVNEIPGLYKLLSGSDSYNQYKNNLMNSTIVSRENTLLSDASQISRDGKLELSGSAYIISPETLDNSLPNFWEYVGGSNSDQYLELAISIVAAEGNHRVTIPEGTRMEVKLNDQVYGDLFASQSEYLYCYYDTLKGKDSDDRYLNINDLRSDQVIDFDITFDFSTATDFSNISEADYYVKVELLGTTDYRYPRSGAVEDEVSTNLVKGINRKYLGFALETEDMLTLGMNDYNSETSDSGRIIISSRLDFSDYMDSNEGKAELVDKYDGKYFTYVYEIQRKDTEGKYVDFGYEPGSRIASFIRVLDGHIPLADIPATGQDSDKVIISKTVQYTVDVSDSAEGGDTVITEEKPVMEEAFTLFADVPELMKATNNITNYKVICHVYVSDEIPATATVENISEIIEKASVNDFFIFTVARLKTDMD